MNVKEQLEYTIQDDFRSETMRENQENYLFRFYRLYSSTEKSSTTKIITKLLLLIQNLTQGCFHYMFSLRNTLNELKKQTHVIMC